MSMCCSEEDQMLAYCCYSELFQELVRLENNPSKNTKLDRRVFKIAKQFENLPRESNRDRVILWLWLLPIRFDQFLWSYLVVNDRGILH